MSALDLKPLEIEQCGQFSWIIDIMANVHAEYAGFNFGFMLFIANAHRARV
jgi:hypothetical protein